MGASGLAVGSRPETLPQFRMRSVLSRSLDVLSQRFWFLVMIWAIVGAIAGAIVLPLRLSGVHTLSISETLMLRLACSAVGLLVGVPGAGLVNLLVFQHLRDEPIRSGDLVRRVMCHFLPLVVTAISVLAIALAGTICLIFPGVIAAVVFSVALPACIVEGLDPIESLLRSADLTKFHRWPIFGVLVAFGVVNGILEDGIKAASRAGSQFMFWAILMLALVGFGFMGIVIPVLYYELRLAKKGRDWEKSPARY